MGVVVAGVVVLGVAMTIEDSWGGDIVTAAIDVEILDRAGYQTEEYVSPQDGKTYFRQVLIEETGFAARSLELIMDCPSSAGMTDEIVSFIRARELEQVGPGGGDDSEDIQVHAVPIAGIDAWLDERHHRGIPLDPKIFAALYWLKRSGEAA